MSSESFTPPTNDASAPNVPAEAPDDRTNPQRAEPHEARGEPSPANHPMKPPSLARQAWNLAESLAGFVADGCHLVSAEHYRQRLEICDVCDARRDNRCMKCGCRLSLKARGRAFKCPLDKWPA